MKASHFSPDIQEFLFLLSHHRVKYVLVGGEAVIYYGFARLTGDVDFFYEPTAENSQKLYRVLEDFWQSSIPGVQSPEELMSQNTIIQFGVPPNRIDLVSSISGVSFAEAWESRVEEKGKIKHQVCSIYLHIFPGFSSMIPEVK